MFSRLVIVLMLVLFPLQWSVAQGHELRDDARELAHGAMAGEAASPLADRGHTQDPGGVCQFHELAQASALGLAFSHFTHARFDGRRWAAPTALQAPTEPPLAGIDRPKWPRRNPVAATL